jgi:oligopeptide/dipeptide ABC transporter ATP-binding protein
MTHLTRDYATVNEKDSMPLIEIENLQTSFFTHRGVVKAVDGVSLHIDPGEIVAVVGESGCGKSATAFSILQLLPNPPGRIVGGSIRFEGRNLVGISMEEMRGLRGNEIAMIFQDPMSALNPALTVGEQIAEALLQHRPMSRPQALARAIELMDLVHIPDPKRVLHEYPHRLSGGMRQRIMIAIALSCEPKLLIADEPTTALDVTVQAQILDLLNEIRDKFNTAIMLITHDLGVVAEIADRVVVMYAGRVVEQAKTADLFARPRHRYTMGLLASVPTAGDASAEPAPLREIPGMVPAFNAMPAGCAFAPRCDYAVDICSRERPILVSTGGVAVACFNPGSSCPLEGAAQ